MQEKPDPPDVLPFPSRSPRVPLSGWQRWSGHGVRLTFWCVLVATLLFVGAVAVARFWLIPNADSFRPRVVSELSRLTGQRVVIGGFVGGWNGWSPELKLSRLQILDARGKPLLLLPDVETTISWRSLFFFEPRLSALTIRSPRLLVRRTAQNALTIAGIDVDFSGQSEGDPALFEWLLKQRLVQIVGGEIEWQDEWRKLPALRLNNVNIRLLNSGSHHSIGMTAVPPEELASPIDVRGIFTGADLRKISDWDGLAYLRTDHANLGLFTRYFPLPFEISRGDGGLQAWFEIDGGQPVAVTTDLSVRQAKVRLPSGASVAAVTSIAGAGRAGETGRDDFRAVLLEPLELAALAGRLSWRSKAVASGDGKAQLTQQRWSVRDLSAVTTSGVKTSAATGEVVVDFRGDEAIGGTVRLAELDLGSLNTIAKSLPLTDALRSQLQRSQPTGLVRSVDAKWHDQSMPGAKSAELALGRYFVEGSAELANLAWREHDGVPGVAGLSAMVKGSTRDGAIKLGSVATSGGIATTQKDAKTKAAAKTPPPPTVLDFGKRFDAPLSFDSLRGALKWVRKLDASGVAVTSVDVTSLAFENADVAGTVSGAWHSDSLGSGVANLTGTLSRGEVSAAHRYLPTTMSSNTRAWLRQAVLAGTAQNARFLVKGPLWHFPFHDDRDGVFELTGQVTGAVLDYADHWPRAENINTQIAFRGTSLAAAVSAATIAGVPIAATTVRLADTSSQAPMLEIHGSASAPLDAFLHWVVASPVNGWLDGFLQPAKASGNGHLKLSLNMPLETPDRTRVTGEFVFAGNHLELGGDIPPLDTVTGSIRFSEADFHSENVTAEALGGPLKVAITSEGGRIRTQASGSAAFERVRERFAYPGLDQLSGQAQWQLETAQPTKAASVVGGSVAGAAVTSPGAVSDNVLTLAIVTVQPRWAFDSVFQVAPTPRDSALPMKINLQRATLEKGRDRLTIEIPGQLHAILERSAPSEADVRTIERATLDIGTQKTALPARGFAVRGEVLKLDADAAIAFLNHPSVMGKKSVGGLPSESSSADFVSINLRATEAILYAHKFNDVTLRAQPTGQRWRLALRSKEATGVISLDAAVDTGVVDAVAIRLQRFSWPTPVPVSALVTATEKASPAVDNQRWPKLDLTADSFVSDGRDLGKLEMRAQPASDEWRIEQVKLSSADGTIEAKGRWRPKGGSAILGDTAVDVTLNWSDAGKFMARYGLPKGVDRGAGSLTGAVSWPGSPAQFSYAKLGGKFTLETTQGRFTEMEPGIGKLLGVLSLQAIPRRLSLNFDDLFGKGLAFDEIKADVAIKEGVASTDSLTIYGPSSRVQIRGSADINRETQDLQVRVFPSLSTATAIGIGLATANPAIGAAALLGQKLARDPIERFLMQEFSVKGTWSNPDVKQSRDATPALSGATVTRVE